MKVLIATSEAIPFAKTGGLADVTGTLFNALPDARVDVRMVMPLYRGVRKKFKLVDTGVEFTVALHNSNYTARVFSYEERALFIENDNFFDRAELYGAPAGEYDDNASRFIFFSKAVLHMCMAMQYRPHVIHCNDWQSALIPILVKTTYKKHFASTATLLTIHNLGYQGMFPSSTLPLTGLGKKWFTPEGVEFFGQVNLLKAGILTADALNTVSEKYAQEIIDPADGFGLEGVLQKRALSLTGILNGLDYREWNPGEDEAIESNYSVKNMTGKQRCKSALAKECAFTDRKSPIVGIVGRLSAQKGIDLVMEAAPEIISSGFNIVVLGKGEEVYHRRLKNLARRNTGRVKVKVAYDDGFARRIYAGCDIVLMPSRYEPCGLVQMIAMSYGTVPVARATGGLADTISDYDHLSGKGTGFLFKHYGSSAMLECLKRALAVYTVKEQWERLSARCMRQRFLWKDAARKYVALYESISKQANR